MTRSRNELIPLALLLTILTALGLVFMSAATHREAPRVRDLHKNGLCEGAELWFSPPRGTVLVLCGIPDSVQWGGLIYRVTENYGHKIIPEPYEVMAFTGTRHYWDSVLARDGYVPLAVFPDVERVVRRLW